MFPPLHHGDAPADANIVERFLATDFATFAATFLHTFGALLFTAGLLMYLYEARRVRRLKPDHRALGLSLLPLAHASNILGIGMNGLGGLMRLYQPDHPGIQELSTSVWVQVLLIKHVFLVIGIGLALYLTYHTERIARGEAPVERFAGASGRITAMAIASFVTILAASVLGAVASTTTLPAAESEAEPMNGTNGGDDGAATKLTYSNNTGTITGTALMPGRATRDVSIPAGASELYVELKWDNAQTARLELEVQDPTGTAAAGERATGTARITFTKPAPLAPGPWKVVVTTSQAVNENFLIVARVTEGAVPKALELTCFVSNTGRTFAEINLDIRRSETFNWTWEVVNDPASIYFNIHIHEGGQTINKVEGTHHQLSGTYVHDASVEVTSLLWENRGDHPLRVHFRIEGQFTFQTNSPC